MTNLDCVLGRMDDLVLPQFLGGGADLLRQYFDVGSKHDIALQIDESQMAKPLKPGWPEYYALDLQLATMQLTHNPAPPALSQRVAVLFANYYQPNHGVLGVMFDRGKASWWDDPNPSAAMTASPREGCAIFLKAIEDLPRVGIEWERQALFTTVHEMGHLFNLQHVDPPIYPPSFMSTSQKDAAYQPEAFAFLSQQQDILATCSTSSFVHPGGAPFDGDSGDIPQEPSRRPKGQAPFGLELRLEMSQREFWRFEPVELEIEIRVVPGVDRRFSIPDIVDPGYDGFVIWLESPQGERWRYRSPRHYCAAPGRITVTPRQPFRRDVSIFGNADGYTFKRPGIWRIWAEFQIGRNRALTSATIEVNVRPRSSSPAYRIARERLTADSSANLLYHRLIREGTDGREALAMQADDGFSPVEVGGVEFALGRALGELGRQNDDVALLQSANTYLRRARDREGLGEHRRRSADRLISAASAAERPRRAAGKA